MDIAWRARASVPAEPDSPRERGADSAAWSEASVRERDLAKSRGCAGRGGARKRGLAPMPDSGPRRNSRHRRCAAIPLLRVPDLPAGTRAKGIQVQQAARAQPPAEISTALEMTARGLVLSANYPHRSPPSRQETARYTIVALHETGKRCWEIYRTRSSSMPAVRSCGYWMRSDERQCRSTFRTMNFAGDSA